MNAHSMPFSKIVSSESGAREHYHVPKYQREYTWGKVDWERLLQDIDENDAGYFMGSIICVQDGEPASPGDELIYEVVDGQQRLTTLSLLMMAIYQRLTDIRDQVDFEDDEDSDDFQNALTSLRNKLVKKKKKGEYRKDELGGWVEQSRMHFLRVKPSSQNKNLEDYQYLLSELELIADREKPRYLGVRAICKAQRYFLDKIPASHRELLALVAKINQLNFVHISVSSQADAFTLFETLNNRGVPLSAIDIIKNKILAEMEKQHKVNIDESYDRWQDIVGAIPDATDQERFLRHVYNAFRWDPAVKVDGIPRAVKSKIIAIYERLIRTHAEATFGRLCKMAETYGKLISPGGDDFDSGLRAKLTDLSRINASPAYQVLLYLFSLPKKAFADHKFLSESVELLGKYYVRRNVTDFPGTRDLDQAHMDLIQACQARLEKNGTLTLEYFRSKLLASGKYSDLSDFRTALSGGMYGSNVLMTRYLLVKLDETHHTREYAPDLWARNDGDKYVWTVEHVLPQTESIPAPWVDMFAGGDAKEAAKLHERHVDRLGNLTLSGYNSQLATASFEKKQKLIENRKFLGHSINIGYQNGLALNELAFKLGKKEESLGTAAKWTADLIEARTKRMVDLLVEMYRFEEVD